jgi:hypothetical protein
MAEGDEAAGTRVDSAFVPIIVIIDVTKSVRCSD